MNIYDIAFINQQITENPTAFVAKSEQEYNRKVKEAAAYFFKHKEEKPLILLSGPSGSGKTTTAKKIKKALEELGASARYLSMDQYFLPADEPNIPYNQDGSIDFESPHRIDIPLFSEQMRDLFQCKLVETPRYDFSTQRRMGTYPLLRQPGEFVIVEGIHALNPLVIGTAMEYSSKLYISVRTRLHSENRALLNPAHIRLLRRLLRDRRERGRSFAETMRLLPRVTQGEDANIMPFKKYAEVEFDSFIPYEIAVYRDAVLEELSREPACNIGEELTAFLNRVLSISWEEVPADSILREFIGKVPQLNSQTP